MLVLVNQLKWLAALVNIKESMPARQDVLLEMFKQLCSVHLTPLMCGMPQVGLRFVVVSEVYGVERHGLGSQQLEVVHAMSTLPYRLKQVVHQRASVRGAHRPTSVVMLKVGAIDVVPFVDNHHCVPLRGGSNDAVPTLDNAPTQMRQ